MQIYIYFLYTHPLFSFGGGNWISLLPPGGTLWEIRVKGNFTPRSDNGRINSSPVTVFAPVTKLQRGRTHNITVPGMYEAQQLIHEIVYTYTYTYVYILHMAHACMLQY